MKEVALEYITKLESKYKIEKEFIRVYWDREVNSDTHLLDLGTDYDILYIPKDVRFCTVYRLLISTAGVILNAEPIDIIGNTTEDKETMLFPGSKYFQKELDGIDILLKKVWREQELVDEIREFSWEIDSLEKLRDTSTVITELESSFYFKHEMKFSFLLKDGRYSNYITPYDWCEYEIDKESGRLKSFRKYYQQPPSLM